MEKFKDIPWYEGKYQVSNKGRIKNIKFNKILNPYLDNKEYLRVSLYKNRKRKVLKVHRLVLQTFYKKSDLTVNHKNGIKDDNRLENLEYMTIEENVKHAYRIWLYNLT